MMSRISLICLLLPLLILTTCEEGADHTITLEFPLPQLAFSPDSLYFTLPGDSLLSGQRIQKEIQLWNRGAGTVRWTLANNKDWLALSSSSGSCDDTVSRVVVTALFDRIDDETVESGAITLVAGNDTATIHIEASKYSGRQICASDSSFAFDGHTDPASKDLLVRTCGSWESHWTAYANRSWLMVTPEAGSSSGEWQRLEISVDWSQFLYPVEERGWIMLDGPNDIWIEVRVSWPGPALCLDSKELYEFTQLPMKELVPFRIRRCEPGRAIDWTVVAEDSWVVLSPDHGESAGEWDTVTMNIDWSIDWSAEPDLLSHIFVVSASETLTMTVVAHPACQLTFVEPAAGTHWTAGELVKIRWTSFRAGGNVFIYLFKGSRDLAILRELDQEFGMINDGELLWVVSGRNLVTGFDYHLEIHSTDYWNTCVARSEDFAIIIPSCYVAVSIPNVYYRYNPNDIMAISWSTYRYTPSVTIDLYLGSTVVHTITPETVNDGRFHWRVPSLSTGDNWYQVRVSDADDPACAGFSEQFWIGE